jgi:hypothetical protein
MMAMTNRRASAPARSSKSKGLIIDVDDLAEERARRRSMKKRVSILFKSFRRHSTMAVHKDASHSEGESSKTWDLSHSHSHEEDRGIIRVHKLLPQDQDPFRAAEAAFLLSSSSASLSSMSDHHEEEEDEELPELNLVTTSTPCATTSTSSATSTRLVVNLGTVVLLCKILAKRYPRKIKRRVSFATLPTEDLCDIVEPVPHIPFVSPKSLPKDLTMEIVLFRRPLVVQPVRPSFNSQLSHEILRFDKNLLQTRSSGTTTTNHTVEDTTTTTTSSTELVALQQKCADLSKITELLSKQLVESTLSKKRDTKLQRKETLSYQEAIRKLEEQHRAHCAALLSDKKYLEGQLRHCKVETVPPVVKSPNDQKNKIKKKPQQRKTFMDDLKEPVQICLRSPMSPTASFSMASTMILQNKLMPALLSAVARANAQP